MVATTSLDFPMVIEGAPVTSAGEWLDVRSPATRAVVGRVPAGTPVQVDRAVSAARVAFEDGRWSRRPPGERAAVLNDFAGLIEKNADALAALETAQTGSAYKLRRDSDLPFAIDNLRFFAGAARHLEGKAAGEYTGSHTSFIRREPVGVVGQISSWNYPLWMAVWKIAPALAAGNSVVLKPATATPLTTVRLAELALQAGLPAGVFNVITGRGDVVGAALAAHDGVDLVSLTGDSETGRSIMKLAAGNVKRIHLELGGKAPFIVHADADLEAAARGATAGALINAGQDCTAATRIYVHRSIAEKLMARLAELFASVRVGDPMASDTDMGTLISQAQVARVAGFVQRAVAAGARVLVGGDTPRVPGFPEGAFYLPTVVAGASQESEIVQMEVFGPVLVVLPFDTEEESLRMANDTAYGLAGSVWTSNLQVAMRATRELNFGHVQVNDHLMVASEMPHGGFKQSGFGKDMSAYSFEEYTRVKHVMIELTGQHEKPWHYTIFGSKKGKCPGIALTPAKLPTMYFVGVSTARSIIMRVFPAWARHMGFGECQIKGIDLAQHDHPDRYRDVVTFIKNDPLSLGALVTTHKIDLLHAARDLFDGLDDFASLMGEVSSISKNDGRLLGAAKDPITSGLALDSFLPQRHWSRTKADAFIMGAGGSSIALCSYILRDGGGRGRPSRLFVSNRSSGRLDEMRAIHGREGIDFPVHYIHTPRPEDNDAIIGKLAPESLVVNATGLGKDGPGSPITDAARLPEKGFAWDFNYRGELEFLRQARRRAAERRLHVEDGWRYFIYGWLSVIGDVFHRDVPLHGRSFEELCRVAERERKGE
jgi:betaine-aldehyde dehydrogenase